MKVVRLKAPASAANRALALVQLEPERRFLERRLSQLPELKTKISRINPG